MQNLILEVCCTSMADVISARDGGATRVELCSAISEGGLTPSAGLIAGAVRERGHLKINVLIRPRSGNFIYSTREIAVMEADIAAARAAGADGVVIGALTPDSEVDAVTIKRLLNFCDGMDVTFHRAFDEVQEPRKALEQLIELGIPRLLTSGCAVSAYEGKELIGELVKQAAGRISIMPGAGINPSNIREIAEVTGASEFHSTCTDKTEPLTGLSELFGSAPRPTSAAIVEKIVRSLHKADE